MMSSRWMKRLRRRELWIGLALILFVSGMRLSAAPNVVLVMADDQGLGDMHYTGHPQVWTPEFDRAAAAGLRFDRFYAAAPVCSPTRASVLTGRHPNRSAVFKWGHVLRPQEITLAEQLVEAGYATAHFGKWHLGSVRRTSPANPGAHGFQDWWSAPNFYDNDPILSHRGMAVPLRGESSIVAAERAMAWMENQVTTNQDKPFLAVVWFGSPHLPHQADEDDRSLYDASLSQEFLGEITGMDRAFGMLRRKLKTLGIRDNTVLWYCSDNGALPKVGNTAGLRAHKGKVYEGGLRVPAFVEWPAVIKEPRTSRLRCSTSDIMPTILQLASVAPPKRTLDGVSLLPTFHGHPQESHSIGFWDYTASGRGVKAKELMEQLHAAQQNGEDLPPDQPSINATKLPVVPFPRDRFPGHAAWIVGDWKLHRIENEQGDVTLELYQLEEDRAEQHNQIESEPARVRQMAVELESWLASVVDSINGADYQ